MDREGKRRPGVGGKVTSLPELNVLLFAFLVNYPWEFLQVPFFEGMAAANHWDAIVLCTRATVGDALIALAAFWTVGLLWRERGWIARPRSGHVGAFVAVGVLITVVLEWYATGPGDRWVYAEGMPVAPVLGTGLMPLLQWLLLPPLVVWLVRRQIGP